ncbi:MAG: bifunctional UDP-sugar hydrolase/5'-nucleotidase, partial [Dermabacter sp.]|nr:bifunctional UDP-sugar hydrolase/5'-nucleotidase [Dermabacter sp.]
MARPLRSTASLLAATLALATFGMGGAQAAEGDQVTVFGINDFHGRITSSGNDLACTLERQRAGADTSFFLSAGDNIGATEFASFVAQDNPTIDYLNAIELDASAVGNHEFDAGFADLEDRVVPRADFTYLGANVYGSDGTRALPAYSIEERDGVRVAVIGVVTEQTSTLVSPGGIRGITFRDPVEEVNKVVAELKAEGVQYDLLVASYHDGSSSSAAAGVNPGGELLNAITGGTDSDVDLILTGHTHRDYSYLAPKPDGSGTRPVLQTGDYGKNLASVTFTEGADGTYAVAAPTDVKLIATAGASDPEKAPAGATACTDFPRYRAASGIVQSAREYAVEAGSKVVGSIAADITTAWAPSKAGYVDGVWTANAPASGTDKGDDRSASSALANAAAEAQVWALKRDTFPGQTPDIGVQVPGSMRAELFYGEDGEVTVKDANDVMPFGNTLYTASLTGEQFTQVLEEQWQPEGVSRPYLQLGLSEGVTYTYDESRPKGDRITGVWLHGEALDPAKSYTVVGPSFVLEGGDNFRTFTTVPTVDTGLMDRDVWMDYLEAHPNLAPNFAQQAVGFERSPVPAAWAARAAEDAPVAGEQWRFTTLHSTSLGAPQIDRAQVTIGDATYEAPYVWDEEFGEYAAVVSVPGLACGSAATGTPARVSGMAGSTAVTNSALLPVVCVTGTPPVQPTPTPTPPPHASRPPPPPPRDRAVNRPVRRLRTGARVR